jgi:SAM-dependent methyltransferase
VGVASMLPENPRPINLCRALYHSKAGQLTRSRTPDTRDWRTGATIGVRRLLLIIIGMTVRYDDVLGPLRAAYDARAAWRDGLTKDQWKLDEREAFRRRLEPGARLLEIGAGTGQDSAFFQENGLAVVAVDLSAAMVDHCRAKGIEAHVMDVMHLGFPVGSFDAVFAMNCLLHVPNHDLPAVLTAVRAVLRPGGLFFIGVFGGSESAEGPLADDEHVPPRFFSWRTDEQLLDFATGARFDIVDFHPVDTGGDHGFQSLTLRRPDPR